MIQKVNQLAVGCKIVNYGITESDTDDPESQPAGRWL